MNIKDLEEQVSNFKKSLLEINRKRKLWDAETRNFIETTLLKIKESYDLNWEVYLVGSKKNMEGVNLTFGHSLSGIYEASETGLKSFTKQGGTLTFVQAYNGDIFIVILYPVVDELITSTAAQKLVEMIDPKFINEEFIVRKVSEFLIEMTEWENSKSSKIVGFKH